MKAKKTVKPRKITIKRTPDKTAEPNRIKRRAKRYS
jgi:hypothetical protein